jgi:hypothetical protein
MLGIFRKKTQRTAIFTREDRNVIEGDVYIKRVGQGTLHVRQGNISNGGLYAQIPNHDLERGKKVEIVIVKKNGAIRKMSRMMGIIIRVDEGGVAMVTYKKQSLNSRPEFQREEKFLKQEFRAI